MKPKQVGRRGHRLSITDSLAGTADLNHLYGSRANYACQVTSSVDEIRGGLRNW